VNNERQALISDTGHDDRILLLASDDAVMEQRKK